MRRRTSIVKLCMPPLFGLVAPPRLFERLDENRGRPLIWIESPPGAGKTSLVASYLQQNGLPALWYQVDAGDADPANIFHYLSLAAQPHLKARRHELPKLAKEHGPHLDEFAALYFRRLFQLLPEGAVLVFDNVQDAGEAATTHEVPRAAVAQVPPASSILCLSRREPPTGYVELTMRGALCILHWDALRLDLDEIHRLAAASGLQDELLLNGTNDHNVILIEAHDGGVVAADRLYEWVFFDAQTNQLPEQRVVFRAPDAAIPEPASLLLLGGGFLGFIGARTRASRGGGAARS